MAFNLMQLTMQSSLNFAGHEHINITPLPNYRACYIPVHEKLAKKRESNERYKGGSITFKNIQADIILFVIAQLDRHLSMC